jgi:monothiol glutaredoxin
VITSSSETAAVPTPEGLKARIEAAIPSASAAVTGDGRHFRAVVTSPAFAGLSRIAQHQIVHDVFGTDLGERIHALSIQTNTLEGASMNDESNPTRDAIKDAIESNPVILFMKGTREAPMCGFSARTVTALQQLNASFTTIDVLADPRIRQELSALSNWPTIPQLFVNGELIGGCDIVVEMHETGELAQVLRVEQPHSTSPQASKAAAAQLGSENARH